MDAIDVFKDCHLGLPAGFPCAPPDQFSFDGFEERLNSGVIKEISFAAPGCPEPMLAQDLLIVV